MSNIRKIVTHGGPSTIALEDYVGQQGDFLLDPDGGQILFLDGSTPGGIPIGGDSGGLTGFTASLDTAIPNDSVNSSVLMASGGTGDQDIVIAPAGAGGFALAIATGDSSGGNKRGQYAVDLQIFTAGKNSPTQIASGAAAFCTGVGNTASGSASTAMGWSNIAGADAAHAIGFGTIASAFAAHAEGQGTQATGATSHAEGQNTLASGNLSHAEGNGTTASDDYAHAEGSNTTASGLASHAEGNSTTASGEASHAGGNSAQAIGNYSFSHGVNTIADGVLSFATGQDATARGIPCMQVYSTGNFAASGDVQAGRLILKGHASDASLFHLTTDGAAPGASNQFVVPVDASFAFTVTVLGRDPSTTASAMYTFTTLIKNTGGGMEILSGTTTTATTLWADDGASAWQCIGSIDPDNSALVVKVQGDLGVDVHWIAEVRSLELVIPDIP